MPHYDANGNVRAMLERSTGTLGACFEYDAFGQTLRASGAWAGAATPFRFSTQYTDLDTGLLYYGRRYYSPSTGRWLGRDPIGEKGGRHLYAFVRNNAVNLWDVFGNIPYGISSGNFISPETGQSFNSGMKYWSGDDRWDTSSLNSMFFGAMQRGSDIVNSFTSLEGFRRKIKCGQLSAALKQSEFALAAYNSHWNSVPEGSHRTSADDLADLPKKFRDLANNPDGDDNGLAISVFKNDETGAYTIAFRGTENGLDWRTNVANGLGAETAQYSSAVDFAVAFQAAFRGASVSLTGHSLGGGLAAAAGLKTGFATTTFNAAGIGSGIINKYDLGGSSQGNITNYRTNLDPVTALQEGSPAALFLPSASGIQHTINAASLTDDILDRHSMVNMAANIQKARDLNACDP